MFERFQSSDASHFSYGDSQDTRLTGWHSASNKDQYFGSTEACQRPPFRPAKILLLYYNLLVIFFVRNWCARKRRTGEKLWSQFLLCVKISRRQGSRKKHNSTKTLTMTLINIDNLLQKDLDINTLDRDKCSAHPAPVTHNGGNTTAQAVWDSPNRNTPPMTMPKRHHVRGGLSDAHQRHHHYAVSLQPPNGGATMVQTDQTLPHINGPPLQGHNFFTADTIGETETTTPEDIADRITEMMETFCDLSGNQE